MADQENKSNEVSDDELKAVSSEPAAEANSAALGESDPNAETVVEQSAELEAAHEEIAKLKDAFLRAKAEQDNIRRRSEKEISNGRKFAVEGFAKEMMNAYDSLKLACSVEIAEDADDTI
jgi:molecular chaperone GrpE